MLSHAEQGLVAVLPVEVDEAPAFLRELRDGREAAVAIRPRPAVPRDHTAEHDLVLADHEPPLDRALRRAVADGTGVRPPSDEQLDGVDEQRLACSGLARECGHARAEHEHELVDDPEVADSELGQHGSAVASAITQAELRLEDAVEVALPERDESSAAVRGRALDDVALLELAHARAVNRQGRRAVPDHLEAERLAGIEDQRTVEQHVRRHRREQQQRGDGETRSAPVPKASTPSSRLASRR